ncbi:hypothetical protein KEM60_02105 [Austwickia sp. TVS 96-490-7B]|uniref:hypothetical protein n=1 Tax=Austwickia sp. TVS 96-490-7B TaxID=2830843 RepID=UPI001C563F2C|nr:hypothetical protein [Austwickia sp. TVS 96-490-7B]MBW3085894.1 hypothetical protein [Austwickia sp. TVS 96-490-7B]
MNNALKVVTTEFLTSADCVALADEVVMDFFANSGEPGERVSLSGAYWRSLGSSKLTVGQWIYLCCWMRGRGMVVLPPDFGWISHLIGFPPSGLDLTQKQWGSEMSSRHQPGIHIGSNSGNINIGDTQLNFSGRDLTPQDYRTLASALRQDAQSLSELGAESGMEAAAVLEGAAEGTADPHDVKSTMKWIQRRGGEAVGAASGAALYATNRVRRKPRVAWTKRDAGCWKRRKGVKLRTRAVHACPVRVGGCTSRVSASGACVAEADYRVPR